MDVKVPVGLSLSFSSPHETFLCFPSFLLPLITPRLSSVCFFNAVCLLLTTQSDVDGCGLISRTESCRMFSLFLCEFFSLLWSPGPVYRFAETSSLEHSSVSAESEQVKLSVIRAGFVGQWPCFLLRLPAGLTSDSPSINKGASQR